LSRTPSKNSRETRCEVAKPFVCRLQSLLRTKKKCSSALHSTIAVVVFRRKTYLDREKCSQFVCLSWCCLLSGWC
jgi:hypothetical protein